MYGSRKIAQSVKVLLCKDVAALRSGGWGCEEPDASVCTWNPSWDRVGVEAETGRSQRLSSASLAGSAISRFGEKSFCKT